MRPPSRDRSKVVDDHYQPEIFRQWCHHYSNHCSPERTRPQRCPRSTARCRRNRAARRSIHRHVCSHRAGRPFIQGATNIHRQLVMKIDRCLPEHIAARSVTVAQRLTTDPNGKWHVSPVESGTTQIVVPGDWEATNCVDATPRECSANYSPILAGRNRVYRDFHFDPRVLKRLFDRLGDGQHNFSVTSSSWRRRWYGSRLVCSSARRLPPRSIIASYPPWPGVSRSGRPRIRTGTDSTWDTTVHRASMARSSLS